MQTPFDVGLPAPAPLASSLFQPISPAAMVASGLGLTGGVGSRLGIRVHNDHSIGILDGNHRVGSG
jgi:hypothetical protein